MFHDCLRHICVTSYFRKPNGFLRQIYRCLDHGRKLENVMKFAVTRALLTVPGFKKIKEDDSYIFNVFF